MIAARKGTSVQRLMTALVDGLVRRELEDGPTLATVISRLRERRGRLRSLGIAHLSVVGSVARGDASAKSDVDLVADFASPTPISVVRFASLKAELEAVLAHAVDLADRAALEPGVRSHVESDAVRVF